VKLAARAGSICVAASAALVVPSAPAAAAPDLITGKLNASGGYTVIALASNGRAKSVRTKGSFKLRPPAERVTLHLRAANGIYAGPITVGTDGKRAVVGVMAGAKLGQVDVHQGYATLAAKLPGKWLDKARTARAVNGVPIGASVFGRVKSKPPRGAPAGDRDLDGIPNPLDVDDDGDRILDNFDRSKPAHGAAANQEAFAGHQLGAGIEQTANADAAGLTVEQMDALLSSQGTLGIYAVTGDSVELDCGQPQSRADPLLGGLVYCSKNGTGRLGLFPGMGPPRAFPGCCDADSDGFGTIDGQHLLLHHGATTAQIGTGDVLIERVVTNGVETQYPAVLQYVAATVPALVSYSDGQGNSAAITYPVPQQGAGTRQNGLPVKAGPDGDIKLTLTFWRPQRRPIPPEPGEWTDIGRLIYQTDTEPSGRDCPQSAYSTTDPDLAAAPENEETGGLRDLAPDRPASPVNTIAYKLNLTRCLGADAATWEVGQTKYFNFQATTNNREDRTVQGISFKLQ
jgi:hypothetical protein